MSMLSVIIPSYKDPYLQKTIESLLMNAEGEIEVVVVLDGYWPDPIKQPYDWSDKRIKIVHLGQNGGMRNAINVAVQVSKGEYIMRTDEHCTFGKGFDRILLEDIEDNWIVTARRFFLDPVKWEVMDKPYVDYERLIIDKNWGKFSGVNWQSRMDERKDILIDETMAMQGSMWVMKRTWWNSVIKELQTEGYGPQNQDSIEMVFKTWQAGGKLMVNKKTWYAHKHRDFPRTHSWQNQTKIVKEGYEYALNVWGNYFEEIKTKW